MILMMMLIVMVMVAMLMDTILMMMLMERILIMMVVTILTLLVSLPCLFPSSPSNDNIDDGDDDAIG